MTPSSCCGGGVAAGFGALEVEAFHGVADFVEGLSADGAVAGTGLVVVVVVVGVVAVVVVVVAAVTPATVVVGHGDGST